MYSSSTYTDISFINYCKSILGKFVLFERVHYCCGPIFTKSGYIEEIPCMLVPTESLDVEFNYVCYSKK